MWNRPAEPKVNSQQTSIAEIQTSFGVVKINCYGEVTVDEPGWNRMARAIHDLTQLSGQYTIHTRYMYRYFEG